MKTQWTLRVRLCALALAGIALAGVGTPARADDSATARPVPAANSAGGPMGPGPWSSKSPTWSLYHGGSGSSDDTMLFHTSDQQPARQMPMTHLGPGPWSSKSPFSGVYVGGSL